MFIFFDCIPKVLGSRAKPWLRVHVRARSSNVSQMRGTVLTGSCAAHAAHAARMYACVRVWQAACDCYSFGATMLWWVGCDAPRCSLGAMLYSSMCMCACAESERTIQDCFQSVRKGSTHYVAGASAPRLKYAFKMDWSPWRHSQ